MGHAEREKREHTRACPEHTRESGMPETDKSLKNNEPKSMQGMHGYDLPGSATPRANNNFEKRQAAGGWRGAL